MCEWIVDLSGCPYFSISTVQAQVGCKRYCVFGCQGIDDQGFFVPVVQACFQNAAVHVFGLCMCMCVVGGG